MHTIFKALRQGYVFITWSQERKIANRFALHHNFIYKFDFVGRPGYKLVQMLYISINSLLHMEPTVGISIKLLSLVFYAFYCTRP